MSSHRESHRAHAGCESGCSAPVEHYCDGAPLCDACWREMVEGNEPQEVQR